MDEYEQIDDATRKLKKAGWRILRSETIESATDGGPAFVRVRIYAIRPGFRSPPKIDVLVKIEAPEAEIEVDPAIEARQDFLNKMQGLRNVMNELAERIVQPNPA
jgi:hypothetical protein